MINLGNIHVDGKVEFGTKIFFSEEKRPYKVMASNSCFAVCVKPYNPKRTVLYTIIDFKKEIRGAENLIFGMGAESKEECQEMLRRVTEGETEISSRNRIKLNIKKAILPNDKN